MNDNLDRLDAPHIRARMTAVLVSLIALAVLLFSFVTLVSLDRAVAPEVQRRTQLIGTVVRDNIQQTLSAGIPFNAIGGLETYLESMIAEFSEVRRISVTTRKGEVLAQIERAEEDALFDRLEIGRRLGVSGVETHLPILVGNELVGQIRLVSSGRFVEARLRSVLLDASALAIAVVLIGVELTLAMAARSIWRPLRAIVHLGQEQARGEFVHTVRPGGLPTLRRMARHLSDQTEDVARARVGRAGDAREAPVRMVRPDLADMRLALFAFVAATEVTASFLPVYALGSGRPAWLEPGLAAAAPLALYLFVMAAISPLASRVVRRFGPRAVFAAASGPAALALLGMAATDNIAGVILCRGAIAVAYAFATIACQDYALALRSTEGAKVSAVIMAMVFGGTFCGSTVGGIFADRYGYGAAMLLGAALVLIAGAIGYRWLTSAATTQRPERQPPVARPVRSAIFHAFLFGIIAPMNLVTAVCIWYIAPLHLSGQGAAPAEIARVIMLFYLFQFLLGALSARFAGHPLGLVVSITVGTGLAALSLVAFGASDFWPMVGTVTGVGAGYALVRGPALELAAWLAAGAPRRLTLYRVTERAVALCGLLATASVIDPANGDDIVRLLGILVFAGLAVFFVSAALDRDIRGGTADDGVEVR